MISDSYSSWGDKSVAAEEVHNISSSSFFFPVDILSHFSDLYYHNLINKTCKTSFTSYKFLYNLPVYN